jgi:hypothetical protein
MAISDFCPGYARFLCSRARHSISPTAQIEYFRKADSREGLQRIESERLAKVDERLGLDSGHNQPHHSRQDVSGGVIVFLFGIDSTGFDS